MVKLSQRLAAIAKYAENSKSVVDVGTDHGHIPVWLSQLGRAEKITASDIGKGPLESAKVFAAENNVEDRIEFVLTDGLNGMAPVYDTVIIAGMGGETIVSILEAAPWTKNGVHLILQPQSKTEVLSAWLYKNGYTIDDGRIIKDAGKLYIILSVYGGVSDMPNGAGLYIDGVFFNNEDPLLGEYIDSVIYKNERLIVGLEKGGHTSSAEYAAAKELELELRKMKEEAVKWQK